MREREETNTSKVRKGAESAKDQRKQSRGELHIGCGCFANAASLYRIHCIADVPRFCSFAYVRAMRVSRRV